MSALVAWFGVEPVNAAIAWFGVELMSALITIAVSVGAALEPSPDCAAVASAAASVRVEYDTRESAIGRASALIFAPSNSGELRAIDADTGRVLWSFLAPEAAAATAPADLITDIAVLRFDTNGDGVIDASGGDRVWLYFGLKRAGAYYYALDVTARTPRVLWTAGAATLTGLADAWSAPTVARVRVGGATQNGEHFVVVIGGGFSKDSPADGNHLFMLDAASGRLLWSAGSDSTSDRRLAHMTHGIAARVATLDTDGDGFADRLYTADVGGRVWRFDIWNGRSRDQLVTGGVFASLGTAEPLPAAPAASDARRFFAAPDVALIQPRGKSPWYNLAIGSGDVSAAGSVSNRFYAVRDREPFARKAQVDYDAASPVLDADLTDISAGGVLVPDDSPGWKLDLTAAGEGVLAESLTLNGVVMFTTHASAASLDACGAGATNRIYAVSVEKGAAALDLNRDSQVTEADRSAALEQQGIPPGVRIEMPVAGANAPGDGAPGSPGAGGSPGSGGSAGAEASRAPRCLVGAEQLNQCVPFDAVLRTFWKRTSVN